MLFKNLLRKQDIYAYEFEGKQFDTGTSLGYIKTQLHFGLKDNEIGDTLKRYIKGLSEYELDD